MHRYDVKTIKTFELGGKNYKSNQITMDCIDLTVKRSKQHKTTNKRDQITINLHRFDVKASKRSKMLFSSQNNQKTPELRIWSNYNELHRFDIKKSKERKTTKLRRKTFQTTQNYESDHIIIIASIWRQNHQNFWVRWQNYKSHQITMNCIDLTSKR